jgi:uncharacterized membrane protein
MRGLRCIAIVLVTVGVTIATVRGLALLGVIDVPALQGQVQAAYATLGLPIPIGELEAYEKSFGAHPFAAAAHILPAFLFITLAPFQFSSALRARHVRLHRWSGRALLVLAVPLGLSGLFLGLKTPFGGDLEAYGVALAGALFLGSMVKAFIAVRRGDLRGHRIWMTRAFAVALSVSTMRVVLPLLMAFTGAGLQAMFGVAVWIGLLTTIAAAELWLKRQEVGGYT